MTSAYYTLVVCIVLVAVASCNGRRDSQVVSNDVTKSVEVLVTETAFIVDGQEMTDEQAIEYLRSSEAIHRAIVYTSREKRELPHEKYLLNHLRTLDPHTVKMNFPGESSPDVKVDADRPMFVE